ncbi:Nuclear transcription factor Y subunit gamma, partial [Caligus rogercresseyi]
SKREDSNSVRVAQDQVSYYLHLTQEQQQQQAREAVTSGGRGNAAASSNSGGGANSNSNTVVSTNNSNAAGNPAQVIQLHPTQMVSTPIPPPGSIQIVQQIVGPNGEIQQIPIQLTSQQLGLIRAQMTGPSQTPLVIQTAPIQPAALQSATPVVSASAAPQTIQISNTGGVQQVYTISQE